MNEQVRSGKVKKQAGAIYKALTEGYLLADYERAQKQGKPVVSPKQTRTARQRQKLAGELDEAQNSLKWLRNPGTVGTYAVKNPANPGLYLQHLKDAEEKVALLQAQLTESQAS